LPTIFAFPSGIISRLVSKGLTLISAFQYSDSGMKQRLAALFLLLVLTGSTLAGVPLHFGESECSMGDMMDMDCCQAALLQIQTPEVAEAKLCCALSCAQNGTTSPPNAVRVMPRGATPLHPAALPALSASATQLYPPDRRHGPPGTSAPAYLRNLALLI
jgi:hypothetical protein